MQAVVRAILISSTIVSALVKSAVAQPLVVPLWPKGAPGELSDPRYREDTVYTNTGAPRIRHVTKPELYVHLPDDTVTSRPAIVVCPGGGYIRLSMDHEGHDAARWLAANGAVGVVLKYRLPSDTIMRKKSEGPLEDVQEAIRTVRRMAKEWRVDPRRVGVMGFSAGGHVAASASTLYQFESYVSSDTTSARPDFSILLYGVISMEKEIAHPGSRTALLGPDPDEEVVKLFSAERNVTKKTPPAFLVHAANDSSVPPANSIRYFDALRAHGVSAELHLYETGGHGFGLAPKSKGTESGWPDACLRWLRAHAWLR